MLIQTRVSCEVGTDWQEEISETPPGFWHWLSLFIFMIEYKYWIEKWHFEYFQCLDEKTRVRFVATAVARQ